MVVSLDVSESELDSSQVIPGRRGGGGFLSTAGSFMMSSNRAGNDELEDQDSEELEYDLGETQFSGNSISLLPGYTDSGSAMNYNWVRLKPLQRMITGLEACQSGPQGPCQKIAEMGRLTVVTGSVNSSSVPSMLEVGVKGTWTKNGVVEQCALQAKASYVTCPNIHEYTTATCAQCTIGYGQFNLKNFLDVNTYPACVLWFTRADAITRAAFASLRTNSILMRASGCTQVARVGAKSCASLAGKKCATNNRSHKLGKQSYSECTKSCLDNADCQFVTLENAAGGWCIGCKGSPTVHHSNVAMVFPGHSACP